MAFAEFFEGAIPEGRKSARRFGMTNGPVGHAKLSLKHVSREGLDDMGGVFLLHGGTLPNSLAMVKPNDYGLPQEIWHPTMRGMDLEEKPFGNIALRLRWHRALEGLSQAEYAEKAGIKRAQLSNWESGDYRLSIDGALALRKTYGLSLDFMYEGNDDALPMTLRAAWRDRP